MSMTDAEKIAMVRVLAQEPDTTKMPDSTITVYLDKAEAAITRRRYPFGVPDDVTDTVGDYETLQCELAGRYISRRGGEGEMEHSETGVSRRYETVNDEDLLSEVMQVVTV